MEESSSASPSGYRDVPAQRDHANIEASGTAAAYGFDPGQTAELAALVDGACEGAEDMYLVPDRIRRTSAGMPPEFDPNALRGLSATFDYRLTCEQERPKRFAATLQPMEGDSEFPQPLRQASEDIRQLWVGLEQVVTHPIARARFADIVFSLRLADNSREAGSRAIRAYLETVGGELSRLDQGMNLVRAWSITREVALSELEAETIDAMLVFTEARVDAKEEPYAVLPVLQAMTMPRAKGGTPWLPAANALLERALLAYHPSHVVKNFAELVRRRAGDDQARIEHASRVQVQAVLAEAEAAKDGMGVRHHLEIAATEARRLGIIDLAEQAEVGLQQAPPIEWVVEEFEFKVPDAVTGRFMRSFELAQTWQDVLALWISTDAPSGDVASNRETARAATEASPIRSLMTNVTYRDGDMPSRKLTGSDAVFNQELARAETLSMTVRGVLLAQALELIKNRFAIPTEVELETFIRSRAKDVHPPYARALAKALRLFLFGEFEAAVHLAVPKIEAAARALLLHLNEPIYRTQVGDTDGHFLGLGALLPLLCENDFDPNWERYFRTFLLSEGSNFRNLIAHGFVDEVDPVYAALALRACALLVLITPSAPARHDADTVRSALTQPHATVAF
ncbi:DUF7380 domain-containing protein [Glycomyces tritici]|uniref:DUF7380 domain-containing protein n=1 Tax=Glycomyces tritici TaxID=2665176 RepID=A0ABT7YY74_9ACTN|nr:hypothetical protein [Glycomyces tritici]MDN3243183.1 hypothetical protein [Glycomyces tritici]